MAKIELKFLTTPADNSDASEFLRTQALQATMAELSVEIVESVWAACQAGAGEIAGALARTFETTLAIEAGQIGKCGPSRLPDDFAGPALLVVLQVGGQAAVVVLPESTGIVPSWCADPDPTGRSKLATLAQELSMLCLPEIVISDMQQTQRVTQAKDALAAGGLINDGAIIPLHLKSGEERRGEIWLAWPLKNPAGLASLSLQATPDEKPKPAAKPAPAPAPKSAATPVAAVAAPKPSPTAALSTYTRSLLRISVPVAVTLAQKKQPVGRIVELGIGSIIHFNKKCEEMLDLEVNGCAVAQGEPVKVGDKFGLRITGVVLPPEEFKTLDRRRA